MTYYPPPSPYPPTPSPYAGPPAVAYGMPPSSSPARRAGVLLFVLGPVTLLLAGCVGAMAALLPRMPPSPDLDQMRAKLATVSPGLSLEAVFVGLAIVVGVVGVALLALAPFVHRGRRWATIVALVVAGPVLLYQFVSLSATLPRMGNPAGLVGGCMNVLVTAPFVLLIVWLIGALRSRPAAADAYQHYLAQYEQHQRAAQAYAGGYGQGGGYGYAVPPPAAAPPAAESPPIQGDPVDPSSPG